MMPLSIVTHYRSRLGYLRNLLKAGLDDIERHEVETEIEWTQRRLVVVTYRVGNVPATECEPELSPARRQAEEVFAQLARAS